MSDIIHNPLIELIIILVVLLFVAGLTIAAAISGQLTAAVVGSISFIGLAVFLYVLSRLGKL